MVSFVNNMLIHSYILILVIYINEFKIKLLFLKKVFKMRRGVGENKKESDFIYIERACRMDDEREACLDALVRRYEIREGEMGTG